MEVLPLIENDNTTRPFQCRWDTCSKSFSRRADLQRHYRIHNKERPYSCSIPGCRKSFNQKSALTVHIRIHTGEKPHQCQHIGCGKRFSDSSSLARHRHTHTGKRPYKCPYAGCPKMFCRKMTMLKHQRKFHQGGLHHNDMLNDSVSDIDGCESAPTPCYSPVSCPGTASQPSSPSAQSMPRANLLADLDQHMSHYSEGHNQQATAGEGHVGYFASADNQQTNTQFANPMATKSSDFGVIEPNYPAANILADFRQAHLPWQGLGRAALGFPYTSEGNCIRSNTGGFQPASGDCAYLSEGMLTHQTPQTPRCAVQPASPVDNQYSVVNCMQQVPATVPSQAPQRRSQSAVDMYPDSVEFVAEGWCQCSPLVEEVTAGVLPPFGSAELQGFYDGLKVELDDCIVVYPSSPTEAE